MFGDRDVLWLGVASLMMGCGGYYSVGLLQREEVRGCMDNQHTQVVEQASSSGGYLLFNLGVVDRVEDTVVGQ